MASFHIFQPGNPQFNFVVNSALIEPPKERLAKVDAAIARFKVFIEGFKTKIDALTTPLLAQDREYADIIIPLQKIYQIPLDDEAIRTVYKIVFFLKYQNWACPDCFRFKIAGLCSVTIFSPSPKDVFAIHLKKKALITVLGTGANSKACTSLYFDGETMRLVAEKTLYRTVGREVFKGQLKLENPELFSDDPLTYYPYASHSHGPGGLIRREKRCQLMKLYEISLCEFIDLDIKFHLIPPQKVFEIAVTVSRSIKNLHDKNIIHCDIKPDNYLVKFNLEKQEFDWSDFEVVASDYETFRLDVLDLPFWFGTADYQPPTKDRENQHKPADIYALGVFFNHIFKRLNPNEELQGFIARMRSLNAAERPAIAEVLEFFQSKFQELSAS